MKINLKKIIKNKLYGLLHIDDKIENVSEQRSDQKLKKLNLEPIENTLAHDVFIAGYPKSGNTWMQNLIAGLIYGLEPSYAQDSLIQDLVPDVHAKKYYKRYSEITFFKSHNLPSPNMKKVIHLVRDGRDAIASYYSYYNKLGRKCSFEDLIIDGNHLSYSKWHEHTKAWINNPYDAEILILKYEDLIENPYLQLKRVLNFIGLERPNEVFERTVEGNAFQKMKDREKKFGWEDKKWKPKEGFIRKGKIGSYKDEIPENLIDYFEKESFKELRHFNYI